MLDGWLGMVSYMMRYQVSLVTKPGMGWHAVIGPT